MIRSIVVPLDGSSFGEQALPVAAAIARRAGARLLLVHAHLPFSLLPSAGTMPVAAVREQELRNQEAEYLDDLARKLAERYSIPVESELLDGPAVQALDDYVRRIKADLVVMTTHGRGGLSRVWLGSVADGLIRRTHVPVLLIRPREEGEPAHEPTFRRILIPLDGSELAEQILRPATRLAKLFDAELMLLRVVVPILLMDEASAGYSTYVGPEDMARREEIAAEYLERLAERLRGESFTVATRVVQHPQAATAILEEAESSGADLIAMATHGRSGVVRLLLGSVADKVLRATTKPLLLLRPRTD